MGMSVLSPEARSQPGPCRPLGRHSLSTSLPHLQQLPEEAEGRYQVQLLQQPLPSLHIPSWGQQDLVWSTRGYWSLIASWTTQKFPCIYPPLAIPG
jgi:hypothetical protein